MLVEGSGDGLAVQFGDGLVIAASKRFHRHDHESSKRSAVSVIRMQSPLSARGDGLIKHQIVSDYYFVVVLVTKDTDMTIYYLFG